MELALVVLLIVVAIVLVSLYRRSNPILPVRAFTFRGGIMEKYRGSWNPSPSDFVDRHELMGELGVGSAQVLVPNIPASAVEAFYQFPDSALGQTFRVWVRSYGDNGTWADSNSVSGLVKNESAVLPVQGFGFGWVEHIP